MGFSLRLALLLIFLHSITALVVFVAALPIMAKLAALALILLSLSYYFSRDVLRLLPDSWISISSDRDGVSVATRNGSRFRGRVEKNTVACPYFVVLRMTPEGRRLPVSRVIFPDALDCGEYRELCVGMKFA